MDNRISGLFKFDVGLYHRHSKEVKLRCYSSRIETGHEGVLVQSEGLLTAVREVNLSSFVEENWQEKENPIYRPSCPGTRNIKERFHGA